MNTIAIPSTTNKPATMVSQQLGAFTIEPISDGQIKVRAKNGLLVNGLLYSFASIAFQHQEGDWRFWAHQLECLKPITPKIRAEVVARLTVELNAYMKDHPDVMKILEVRSWEQTRDALERTIQDVQVWMVRQKNDIDRYQAQLDDKAHYLREQQEKLVEHLAKRPEGLPADEEGEAPS